MAPITRPPWRKHGPLWCEPAVLGEFGLAHACVRGRTPPAQQPRERASGSRPSGEAPCSQDQSKDPECPSEAPCWVNLDCRPPAIGSRDGETQCWVWTLSSDRLCSGAVRSHWDSPGARLTPHVASIRRDTSWDSRVHCGGCNNKC